MSPIIDGDLVIVSAAVSNWGTSCNRAHRFIALDKRTGEVIYVSNPGGRPYDTAYASPLIATINGMRLLIAGLGDGAVHAIKPQTGERVWSFAAAKRAINTGVAVSGNTVFMSHGDENLEGTQLGLIAAIDGVADGRHQDDEMGGARQRVRVLVADSRRQAALSDRRRLDAVRVRRRHRKAPLWNHRLGTAQKAPPVFADGKIFVGTDNGQFFIIRPRRGEGGGAERGACCRTAPTAAADRRARRNRFSAVPRSRAGASSSCRATPCTRSVRGGRRHRRPRRGAQRRGTGRTGRRAGVRAGRPDRAGAGAGTDGQAARAAVRRQGPLHPRGEGHVVARGAAGHGHRRQPSPWRKTPVDQGGTVKATIGALSGTARVTRRPLDAVDRGLRVLHGQGRAGRLGQSDGGTRCSIATLDGSKVLFKEPNDTLFKRIRFFVGPTQLVQLHVRSQRAATERRRQLGDIGITAQRYSLVLYGNSQKLKIEPWEPETARTATADFAWKAGHVVSVETAGRESGQRAGAGARQGMGGRSARAGGVGDRQDRPDRQSRRRTGAVHRRAVRRATSTTWSVTKNQ